MKGLLAGIFSGAVVSGLGLVAAERFVPVVEMTVTAPDAGDVAVPAGSEFNAVRADTTPILPAIEDRPDSAVAPRVAKPGPTTDSLPDTTPLDAPQAAPLQETAMQPPADAPTPVIVSGTAGESLSQPGIAKPDTPAVDVAAVPETASPLPETGKTPVSPTGPNADADTPSAPAIAAPQPATGPAPTTPTGPSAEVDAPPISMPEAPQGLRLPVPQIEDMAPGVTTDRLPRIGAATTEPVSPLGDALTRNAVAFDNAAGNPLISIVMVDVGAVRPDPTILAEFPVPLTVAIDPTAPDAGALMQAYRSAGLEVAILTPLPEGASPADVEVAFQAFFATLPEAVAVMDVPEALLQENRPRAVQVVAIVADSGHGMVTYERGLNTGLQIASKSSVPAMTVFRDIDPGSHDVAAMKRFLDQAAFRAGLEGNVVLKAEARPETLQALAEWSLGSRAATVAFAPLSAVLQGK